MRLARKQPETAKTDELDALLAASRAASSNTDLDKALEAILDAALRLIGGEEGSIQLVDPVTVSLEIVAARGLEPELRREVVRLGQGIAGTVAVTGQPLLLPGAVDIGRFAGHIPKSRKIYSAICVPLRVGGETIGILSVDKMRPGGAFTENDLKLATLFAETAALAIMNARHVGESNRRAVEVEMLRGAAIRLGASLDVEELAAVILKETLTITGTDTAFICISSADGGPLELARYAGVSREALRAALSAPGFRRFTPPTGVRIVADVATDPVLAPLADSMERRALALVPLRTADGRSDGIIGVAIEDDDVNKELLNAFGTQAGLALSNALLHRDVAGREEELATIVTTIDMPIIMVDEEDRFRAINPAAALMFRLSPEFELGQPVAGKLPQEIEDLLLGTGEGVDEELIVTFGSEERIVRVSAATANTGRGPGGRVLVCADISAQRELDVRKADFLAVIGHELRTPLTNIKGYAKTLAARGGSIRPDVRDDALQTILSNSDRLERLIEDLLYISRVENAQPPLHLAWDDVVAIVGDVVADASRRHPNRIIQVGGTGTDLPIYTDRVKVEQVLTHLVDNALKYSAESTNVRIAVTAADATISIAVKDQGIGIYSGDLEAIFDPFTQIDSTSTRRSGGTGIGLYVGATLADSLGGHIDVDSALGKGSTFTLVLPRKSVDPQRS